MGNWYAAFALGAQLHPQWQREADLLADGRELLERATSARRYRHLYPDGPNLSILFESYQELDRLRTVNRAPLLGWRARRRLRRIILRNLRADAIRRDEHAKWKVPDPLVPPVTALDAMVQRALAAVDADVRGVIDGRLWGRLELEYDPATSLVTHRARERRAHQQFRDAVINEALAHPAGIVRLPPAVLALICGEVPTRRRHPIATLLLVTLPIRLLASVALVLGLSYVGAWMVFNDAVLGRFVSNNVSGLVQGDLEMGSIHWDLDLALDLVTGQPAHVVVTDISVWEPYASYGGERTRRTAHAERLEADLVLHEVIPWNRMGIPAMLEIPWVLHFTRVTTDDAAWFTVREFEATHDDGEVRTLLSLRDAFLTVDEPDPTTKGLSFAVDDLRLSTTTLDLDLQHESGWRNLSQFSWVNASLVYDSPGPGEIYEGLPLSVEVEASAPHGVLAVGDIEVPYEEFELQRFAIGKGETPLGDVALSGTLLAAGSPLSVGAVLDAALPFPGALLVPPTGVALSATTSDGANLVAHLVDELGLPRGAVAGEDVEITASIDGLILDPSFRVLATGLSFDVLQEPAWAADDVTIGLTYARTAPPEPFAREDEAARSVVRIDTLSGVALDGSFTLAPGASPATIVAADDDTEPTLIAIDLGVTGVNPGLLLPTDPDLGARLAGTMEGRIDVERLALGGPESTQARLALYDVELRRDRTPADDGLPQRLSAQGVVAIDPQVGVDFSGVRVGTDGGHVDIDGPLSMQSELDDTKVALTIDNGRVFSRAFGLDPYFAQLRTALTLTGPLTGLSSPPSGRVVVTGLRLPGAEPERRGEGRRGEGRSGEGRSGEGRRGEGRRGEGRRGGPAERRTGANLWFDRGRLRVRTTEARMFGGVAKVDLTVHLFKGDALLDEPRVQGTIDLDGINVGRLTKGELRGPVDVRLVLDDGRGRGGRPGRPGPATIDQLRISGEVRSPKLVMAGTTYHDASMVFELTPEDLQVESLILPLRRAPSPLHAPEVTVEVGRVIASGTIGRTNDPALGLSVEAWGVPLSVVARLLDVDTPLGGRIARGTELRVEGTLSRPKVDGRVALAGVAAGGVPLGDGILDVSSKDVPAQDTLAAHRELRVEGELAGRDRAGTPLSLRVDSVVAFGQHAAGEDPPIDAEVDIGFDQLSLAALMRDPADVGLPSNVHGGLLEVGAEVLACDGGVAMLSACRRGPGDPPPPTLGIELDVDKAWLSGTPGQAGKRGRSAGAPPCHEATTLCSENRLEASLDWPIVELTSPWRLATGGDSPARFELEGTIDLSQAPPTKLADAGECRPPPLGTVSLPGEDDPASPSTRAHVSGTVELAALRPLLGDLGLSAAGRIDLDLSLIGRVAQPTLVGRATPATDATTPLTVTLREPEIEARFTELDVRVDEGWVTATGDLEAMGSSFHFGTVRGEHTGVGVAGACAGHWGVAVEGAIESRLVNALAGSRVTSSGRAALDRLVVTGPGEREALDRTEGTIRILRTPLAVDLTEGMPQLEIGNGRIDFARCNPDTCTDDITPGHLALWVGGKRGLAEVEGNAAPPTALEATVGPRGQIVVWGLTHVAPDLSRAEGTALRVELVDVPYRGYDARGRPVYEIEASSRDVEVRAGDPLVVSGNASVERARYVKDAVQGVEILRLTDDIDVPEPPPPEILRGLQFDLRVTTDSPLRVENNVAHGVEADATVEIGGTWDTPELQGRLDFEPGGEVDIPFLTGTYEIQRGRVSLARKIEESEVDILALRNEPVYIDEQERDIQLLLGGTVREITWSCIAAGDVSRAVESSAGCLDYLVLGAGDVQVRDSDVQRLGGGGLANARKSLQVVGHVTEFDFGDRIEDAAPRYRGFVPDMHLRLGQIGPELEVGTPPSWLDFDYGRARLGWDYTRGYPGFLLLQSRDLRLTIEILDPLTIEFRREIRRYLNERIIFDPLRQRTIELRLQHALPAVR